MGGLGAKAKKQLLASPAKPAKLDGSPENRNIIPPDGALKTLSKEELMALANRIPGFYLRFGVSATGLRVDLAKYRDVSNCNLGRPRSSGTAIKPGSQAQSVDLSARQQLAHRIKNFGYAENVQCPGCSRRFMVSEVLDHYDRVHIGS